MNVTYAKYEKSIFDDENTSVHIITDGKDLKVPLDPANRHYAEIMRQVDEGIITIQDADSN